MEIFPHKKQSTVHSVNHGTNFNAHFHKLQPFLRRKDDKCPVRSSFFLQVLTLKTFSSFRPPLPNHPLPRSLPLASLQMGQMPRSSSKGKYNSRKTNYLLCIIPFLVTGETHSSIHCSTRELIFAYKYVPLQSTVVPKLPPILLFCNGKSSTLDVTEI